MKWESLTEKQQDAASSDARRLVVLGGAGSGKTTVALWSARKYLTSAVAKKSHRVLFLTFSRTAVREILRRSGQTLSNVKDKVEIFTFHSFASRIINSFGRYAGLGKAVLPFRSDAETKLLGEDSESVSYDDLLPLALKMIQMPRINRLLVERWPLVICDEFQDTNDVQWDLLKELGKFARLVFLADSNQMIYDGFLGSKGVGPKRLKSVIAEAEKIVDLGTPSHRDPSNIIPMMAEAVRRRDFGSAAVKNAISSSHFQIHCGIEDDKIIPSLCTEIRSARKLGAKSIGIFGHGNQSIADLSADLFDVGIDHVLVGLPEAHGEALVALERLCAFGFGRSDLDEVKLRLAVFLTAASRGKTPPSVALGLIGKESLPKGLLGNLNRTTQALLDAASEGPNSLIQSAINFWPGLGIKSGIRCWRQSSLTFGAMAHQIAARTTGDKDKFLLELSARVTEQRTGMFFDLDVNAGCPVQLMNFHQTKGREADVVILVFRDDDYFGSETEPFLGNSRLLYVSLSRAKKYNVMMLPPNPHPLVAQFRNLA